MLARRKDKLELFKLFANDPAFKYFLDTKYTANDWLIKLLLKTVISIYLIGIEWLKGNERIETFSRCVF